MPSPAPSLLSTGANVDFGTVQRILKSWAAPVPSYRESMGRPFQALLPALMILVLGLVASMALVPSLDQASSKG